MRIKPDQITRAIRIAKAISEKIDPAFARVDMGVDEDSPVERRLSMLDGIRPAKPYTPSVRGFADGGDVETPPYGQPNNLGLYSHAAATAASLPQARGTPEQFRGMLMNKGVKPTELEWSGFEDAFSDRPQVTREDIASHFSENMPRVSEKILTEGPDPEELAELERRHSEENKAHWAARQEQKAAGTADYAALDREHQQMIRRQNNERMDLMNRNQPPFHGEWTIPGGKNYREILLKHAGDAGFSGVGAHFGGEPDILASLRMKDRTDHEGDKVLHLDELQSDWAQQGRDVGFAGAEGDKRDARNALDEYVRDISERSGIDATQMWPHAAWEAVDQLGEQTRLRDLMNAATQERRGVGRRIERAPYVTKTDDWVDLGLKRALLEAAKGGYDKLAWTPGDEHADRYSLDKHVGQIHHEDNGDGTYKLKIVGRDGRELVNDAEYPKEKIPSLVGKEVAEKIFAGEGSDANSAFDDYNRTSKEFRNFERSLPQRWVQHTFDVWKNKHPDEEMPEDIAQMVRDISESKGHHQMASDMGLRDEYENLQNRYADARSIVRNGLPSPEEGNFRTLSGLDLKVGGQGMRQFYDKMLPKRLMKLAKQHDPETQFAQSIIEHPEGHGEDEDYGDWGLSEEFQNKDSKILPAIRITPRMRESILKKGFAAYASGGEVDDGDEGHPLTQDVYHGIKGEGIGPEVYQGLGLDMFAAQHPEGLSASKPNATALMLGPHVARDPNISGDYRFTTGEHSMMVPGERENTLVRKRVGERSQGQVKMLRTFPDEKFFPVSQPTAHQTVDDESYPRYVHPHDWDDNAVHRLVMSTTFSHHPDLFRKAIEGSYGGDPDEFMRRNGIDDSDPASIDKFFRFNNMRIEKPMRQEIVKRFRKIMGDQGYAGLSYLNTDEDEVRKVGDDTENVADKKCYIVFPQREKETGWSPLRNRYAKFDPARKGRPGLHEADGGAVEGYADGGMPDDDMPDMPEEDAAPTAPENPNGGLLFPSADSQARLARKIKRQTKTPDFGMPKNPRTVIKAPEDSGLPDYVAGDLSFDDWKKRHESILTDPEIHHSASWYGNILGNFRKYYGGDDEKAKKMMRAWLVAQQNVSPAGAMGNVLLQKEQMSRGVPEHLWRAGGMPNPTEAARSVLKGQEISGGVGQKIADFVDSAEGKRTRSWMDDHPHGGEPFVVDVHTARDTGMVDQELLNHLERVGYDPKQLKKLQVDFQGTPSEATYENRAQWGRNLTNHLNKIRWKGREDWTPAEVQAVGWMGMTKLTRNAEEDSESGLGRNLRRISYELSPGEGSPWEKKYSDGFYGLPKEDQYAMTKDMANAAMRHAQKMSGIDLNNIVHGTGAWEHFQNPAAVTHTLATEQGADIAANALGYLLQQTEVWHNRVKPLTTNPKGFAVDFVERGSKNLADQDSLKDFWEKVIAADPHGLIRGYQPIVHPSGEVGVRALIDKGGVKTKEKLEDALKEGGAIDNLLKSLPFNTETTLHEAEIKKARNDWKEHSNGEAYLSRLIDLLGSDPSAGLHRTRAQLEQAFEKLLDQAHSRQGTSWRKAKGGPVTALKSGGPAIDKALLISMRATKKR